MLKVTEISSSALSQYSFNIIPVMMSLCLSPGAHFNPLCFFTFSLSQKKKKKRNKKIKFDCIFRNKKKTVHPIIKCISLCWISDEEYIIDNLHNARGAQLSRCTDEHKRISLTTNSHTLLECVSSMVIAFLSS